MTSHRGSKLNPTTHPMDIVKINSWYSELPKEWKGLHLLSLSILCTIVCYYGSYKKVWIPLR